MRPVKASMSSTRMAIRRLAIRWMAIRPEPSESVGYANSPQILTMAWISIYLYLVAARHERGQVHAYAQNEE